MTTSLATDHPAPTGGSADGTRADDASPDLATRSRRRVVPVVAALFVAAFGFLPIANWIPGGHSAPWFGHVVGEWVNGTVIVVGLGVVLGILSGHIDALWREGALRRVIARFERAPVACSALIALAALALYLVIARTVFGGRPLLIDELVQVLQAQLYAHGMLWRPVGPYPEFFSALHVIDMHGKYFAQFPAGGPAMLTLGVLVGAPWLVGPVCGAITVVAFAAYLRVAEPRPGVALAAILLLAFAPFMAFMSGSHMNHVTALLWVVIAMACLARIVTAEAPRPWLSLAMGLAFGIAGTIRPVDALAFALPAGMWLLLRALRDRRRWGDALPAALGVALPLAALVWVNAQTTGSPLLFGYEMLWGNNHGLGFHRAPWGDVHTPARGLELINLYFLRLQSYLYETPMPALIPCIAALALARRLDRFDRYLLASSALLIGLYFAYWHDGNFLGPRFMYLLLPALALWTARFLPAIRERIGTALPYRTAVYGAVTAGLISIGVLVPLRARLYAHAMLTMRWDADRAAARAGVRHALVFVRESWGSQLVARMWALGVPRAEAELLYDHVDACALDQRITALEASPVRDTAAYEALRPLLADSARTIGSPFSPDTSERYLPGQTYSRGCEAQLARDRHGFTLLTPLLLEHGGGNIYARDLGARDTLLAREHPGRALYLLRPDSAAVGAPPRFHPLQRDSLFAAARGVAGTG